jgi:hypothetical protein
MKRSRSASLLGLTILLIAAGTGFAGGAVKLGVHGGISIPNLRSNETDIFSQGFSSREGPYFGLTADFALATRLSLAVDLNYTSQGGQRTGMQPITMGLPDGLPIPPDTVLWASFSNETILDYIEVPVRARYTFGGKIRFFLDAGPYVGFLVRGVAVTAGTSALYLDEAGTMPIVIPPSTDPLVVDLGAETDVKDSLETVNFGVVGGGGVLVPLGPGDLVLEARFQLGLTTIQKYPETDGHTQTGAVIVSLGYTLPLGKHK